MRCRRRRARSRSLRLHSSQPITSDCSPSRTALDGASRRPTRGAAKSAAMTQFAGRGEARGRRQLRTRRCRSSRSRAFSRDRLGRLRSTTTRASRNCVSGGRPTRDGRSRRLPASNPRRLPRTKARPCVAQAESGGGARRPGRRRSRSTNGSRKPSTTAPDDVLMRLGHSARAAGNLDEGARRVSRASSTNSPSATSRRLRRRPSSTTLPIAADRAGQRPLQAGAGRAERLFGAKRYTQARAGVRTGFAPGGVEGDDRELVELRLAECDYF